MAPRLRLPRERVDLPDFQWSPDWRTTVLVVVLMPILLSLGFWQLSRAAEKAELAAQFAAREAAEPQALSEFLELGAAQAEFAAFRRVTVRGVYLTGEEILLDNRIRNGRFGYEVVSPVRFDGGVVMVNRGWVPGDPGRQQLPDIATPEGTLAMTGYVHAPSKLPYRLGEEVLPERGVAVMQNLDLDLVQVRHAERLFPFEVRLDRSAPGAFDAQWSVINQTPEKHRGYAFQWFAMGAALFMLFLYRTLYRPARASSGVLSGENPPNE
jgi:surfeit locus 1 family protein